MAFEARSYGNANAPKRRTPLVGFNATVEEKTMIVDEAASLGLNVSDFMRSLVADYFEEKEN